MIRRAGVRDLAAITEVRTSVVENHLSVEQMRERGITMDSTRDAMLSGVLAAWVVEVRGRIVAFAMADSASRKLFALFCRPEHSGNGHGAALLDTAENWLKHQGADTICLDTGEHTAAVGFYLKRGYVVVERQNGDVIMRKNIA